MRFREHDLLRQNDGSPPLGIASRDSWSDSIGGWRERRRRWNPQCRCECAGTPRLTCWPAAVACPRT